jgi:hypothetical protein
MALNLKEIQAKLREQQERKDNRGKNTFISDNAVYPFWNNPDGTTATARFLPDGNEKNDFFWEENLVIKLPFNGIKGQVDNRQVEVKVPCMDMWTPNSCPISAEIRPWWKDKQLEDLARKYWRKKSYILQGFVPSNPNPEDTTPENPIRRFIINPSVFDKIKAILMDPDLAFSPTDYQNGYDFYIRKTTKGKYADYDTSSWLKSAVSGMTSRPLNQDEMSAIDKFGLFKLNDFLPKKPDQKQLEIIMEMFAASVDGDPYDPERFAQYYKPAGLKNYDNVKTADEDTVAAPVAPSAGVSSILERAKAFTSVETVVPAVGDKPKGQTPEEIIAAIRARQSK